MWNFNFDSNKEDKDEEKNTNDFNLKDLFNKADISMKSKFRQKQKRAALKIAIIYALISYYILLPSLNIHSKEAWIYVITILAILVFVGGKSLKPYRFFRYTFAFMLVAFGILNIFGARIIQSKNYAKLINPISSNFKEDIEELPIDKIPTLDRDSSIKLGARKMGELLDLVSQFDIDDTTYTQINYKDAPYRVTPLKYNSFIKYLTNMREGLPGYLKIDIVDGDADLVKLENKIKYSKEDYFFRDIYRYARLRYPFEIFGEPSFEIDEDGTPYWIISTYETKVGFFDGLDVNGAILINAVNGNHQKYSLDEIPTWVDRVHSAKNIIDQLDWNGKYQGGYLNSIFTQKNVLRTTEGYNYLALDDDVYLYTGYTSVAADESNVGFVLVNMRTKDAKFYPVSSAKEYSAMESAEGAVQEKEYKATFPLLLNIDGKPTYFLSLKDNAGLIKQYAFIDAQNYQNVSTGASVTQALTSHRQANPIHSNDNSDENIEYLDGEGTIIDIREAVVDGNTYYYILMDNTNKVLDEENPNEIYVASIKVSNKLPFLKNEKIKFKYYKNGNINEIVSLEENE